jgi:hypothetical protein
MIARRNVEIVINEDELDITKNHLNVEAAIAHLAMWAIGGERYANVKIYSSRGNELVATYHDGAGKHTYTIGAVEREDGTYSFHS